jgi:hypothetical protein
MPLPLILAIAAFVIAAVSAGYSTVQAKKAKEKAAREADKRKGFEVPGENDAAEQALAYGRVKIGGTRVFHATRSNYDYVPSNADITFQTGGGSTGAVSGTYNIYNGSSLSSILQSWASTGSVGGSDLNSSRTGQRNDFLFFQQTLCVGPINAVKDVIIDDSHYINEMRYGFWGNWHDEDGDKHYGMRSAMRLDFHYNGGTADTIMARNCSERLDAKFTNQAFLSAVVKLDREQPQFNGVPSIQALIEGRKVYTWTGGVKSGSRIYTNNPVWCLADYLLDPIYGKGIDEDEINWPSFEAAAAICGTIVQTNVSVGGKFYRPTLGGVVDTRNLPLYECNVILDLSKPIRENIEAIISTMGDARLVWSNGQYKVSLQYPMTNTDIDVDDYITDDDLVLDQEVEIAFPDASSRLNFATVRFHNEHNNFREDVAQWPPKYNRTYWEGMGGFRYGVGGDGWDSTTAGDLLNSYSVWEGSGNTAVMEYLFLVRKEYAGSYTLKVCGDSNANAKIYSYPANTLVHSSGSGTPSGINSTTVTLGNALADTVYKLVLTGNNTAGNRKGAAAKIESAGRVLWSSRDSSYTKFVQITKSNAVYNTYLEEDEGLELETTIFGEGITDPYHALAEAERLVRTSRSATSFKYKRMLVDRINEPGDFIKFSSETLNLGVDDDLYLRCDTSKVLDESTIEVTATRFDASQQAWSNKDDQPSVAPPIYNFNIPPPDYVTYLDQPDPYTESSGKLVWDGPDFNGFAGYIIYMHRAGIDARDEYNMPVFTEIGRSVVKEFTLPAIGAASAYFAVRSYSLGGQKSIMKTTSILEAVNLSHSWSRLVEINSSDYTFNRQTDGSIFPATITLTADILGFSTPEYQWYIDGVEQVGETADTLVLSAFSNATAKKITVKVNESGDTVRINADDAMIYYMAGGFDSYNGYLTNEMHSVSADSGGSVLSYTGASGYFNIFHGSVDVSSQFAFTVAAGGNPQNLSVNWVGNAYTITGGMDVGEDIATVTLRAEGGGAHTGVILQKTFTLGKIKTATSSKAFMLTSTSQMIKYDSAGAIVAGQSITFTGQKQNTTADITVTLFRLPGMIQINANTYLAGSGTVTPSGNAFSQTGTTVTLSGANFNSALSAGDTGLLVRAVCDGMTDQISVARLGDGADGAPGEPGPAIVLTPNKLFIEYFNGVETPAGQTISISAVLQNGSGTINWSTSPNVKTGTGTTFTLNSTELGSNAQVVVTATVGTLTQSITVGRISSWESTSNPIYTGPTAPSDPVEGVIWHDTHNPYLDTWWIYTGGQWMPWTPPAVQEPYVPILDSGGGGTSPWVREGLIIGRNSSV